MTMSRTDLTLADLTAEALDAAFTQVNNLPAYDADTRVRQARATNPRPARLVITGREAAEISRHVDYMASVRYVGARNYTEVQGMNECRHGCKLHVRQRGAVRQYALIHQATYGCDLGRDEATREVPVSVRPRS